MNKIKRYLLLSYNIQFCFTGSKRSSIVKFELHVISHLITTYYSCSQYLPSAPINCQSVCVILIPSPLLTFLTFIMLQRNRTDYLLRVFNNFHYSLRQARTRTQKHFWVMRSGSLFRSESHQVVLISNAGIMKIYSFAQNGYLISFMAVLFS